MFKVGDKVIPSEDYKTRYPESPHNPRDCVGEVIRINTFGNINVNWGGKLVNVYEENDLVLLEQGDEYPTLPFCRFDIGDTVQLLGLSDVGTVQDIKASKNGKWQVQVKWEIRPRTNWYYEEDVNFFETTLEALNDTTVNNLNTNNDEELFRISPTISYRSAPRGVSFCSAGKEIRVGNFNS